MVDHPGHPAHPRLKMLPQRAVENDKVAPPNGQTCSSHLVQLHPTGYAAPSTRSHPLIMNLKIKEGVRWFRMNRNV